MMRTRTLYFDMDGVIADFNSKCIELIGCSLDNFPDSQSGWDALGDLKLNMYSILAPMADSKELVRECLELANQYSLDVGILTAIPKIGRVPLATPHKKAWINEHFPELANNFNIGPWAEDKFKHCLPGDILIDDMVRNIDQWNEVGGVGILHTSASNSIDILTKHLAA